MIRQAQQRPPSVLMHLELVLHLAPTHLHDGPDRMPCGHFESIQHDCIDGTRVDTGHRLTCRHVIALAAPLSAPWNLPKPGEGAGDASYGAYRRICGGGEF